MTITQAYKSMKSSFGRLVTRHSSWLRTRARTVDTFRRPITLGPIPSSHDVLSSHVNIQNNRESYLFARNHQKCPEALYGDGSLLDLRKSDHSRQVIDLERPRSLQIVLAVSMVDLTHACEFRTVSAIQ